MSNAGAPQAQVWTHLYFEFALTREERRQLDALTAERDTSLGDVFAERLAELLSEADVDPERISALFPGGAAGVSHSAGNRR